MSFEQGLLKLTNYEIDRKEEAVTKSIVRAAAFPHLKELKDFDFDYQENLNRQQIIDFTSHRFINEKENIVFLGNSGVGKNPFSYLNRNYSS